MEILTFEIFSFLKYNLLYEREGSKNNFMKQVVITEQSSLFRNHSFSALHLLLVSMRYMVHDRQSDPPPDL